MVGEKGRYCECRNESVLDLSIARKRDMLIVLRLQHEGSPLKLPETLPRLGTGALGEARPKS